MTTVTIKNTYLEMLSAIGRVESIVEEAVRKYLIDKCVERLEKAKLKIQTSSISISPCTNTKIYWEFRPSTFRIGHSGCKKYINFEGNFKSGLQEKYFVLQAIF